MVGEAPQLAQDSTVAGHSRMSLPGADFAGYCPVADRNPDGGLTRGEYRLRIRAVAQSWVCIRRAGSPRVENESDRVWKKVGYLITATRFVLLRKAPFARVGGHPGRGWR